MRIIRCCMVSLFLLCFAVGCSQQKSSETDRTLCDIAAAIIESQSELPPLKQVTPEDEDFDLWMSVYYSIQGIEVSDGAICYADGVEASEIAVLLLADGKDCEKEEEALTAYMQNRAGVFEGYAPLQAELAENGTVVVNGRYLAMLICQDTAAAKKAFLSCFGKNAENSQKSAGEKPDSASVSDAISDTEEMISEAADDVYDPDAVLQAWRSGDDSSLSEMNRRILESARNVISQEINDSMSDYEKELAIHDWITGWSRFDYSVFGRSQADGFAPGSDTPYGVLIDQSAMCHGYSSTFQLFMDMLEIECLTVYGIPGSNGVEHSWNMVKLDGEWYCVDVAWDDPIGGSPGHRFFNVTSQYLRDSGIHEWEEGSVPEADSTVYSYENQ
ncbi:MAG: DUF4358 domain-containing protein [Lachnospiraceae bacterium]|nr:DUF4358 domain-containing protein [Lachnospiraceae bacterium]